MKNQLKHTIETGRDKDPVFFDKLAEELEKLLEEEKAGRITQAKFLEQLDLFGQRIKEKDNTGFSSPAHSAAFHYLESHLSSDVARGVTTKLFEDEALSHTMATGNWKAMPDLHPDIKKRISSLLVPLAGWQRTVARDHAGNLLTILLKN
ncbi:hypothetical protein OWS73_27440 [Burkholderia sp. 1B3(2022)]